MKRYLISALCIAGLLIAVWVLGQGTSWKAEPATNGPIQWPAKGHNPTNIPKWIFGGVRTNNLDATITNIVRLSPEECVRLGGHCYVAQPEILNSNPPQRRMVCKHCKHSTTQVME